jgi:hypothetical protein
MLGFSYFSVKNYVNVIYMCVCVYRTLFQIYCGNMLNDFEGI